jgi:hypothetical protein
MQLLLNPDIKIQSVSDIITNSSSEVFCRIESDNKLVSIYEILNAVIDNDNWEDPEINPVCRLMCRENCDFPKDAPAEQWVEIEVPYGWSGREFYTIALPAVLDKLVGENNYKIIYDDY